jgi:hypothetical protein
VPHVRLSVRGPKMNRFDCFPPDQPQWLGASPLLIRPTYAEANVGHPSGPKHLLSFPALAGEGGLDQFAHDSSVSPKAAGLNFGLHCLHNHPHIFSPWLSALSPQLSQG